MLAALTVIDVVSLSHRINSLFPSCLQNYINIAITVIHNIAFKIFN